MNLAEALNRMGAKVSGAGTDVIVIEGVDSLHAAEATVIPDRIETGTYMIAAAITGGDVTINGCQPGHLDALITKLKEAGVPIEPVQGGLRVTGGREVPVR